MIVSYAYNQQYFERVMTIYRFLPPWKFPPNAMLSRTGQWEQQATLGALTSRFSLPCLLVFFDILSYIFVGYIFFYRSINFFKI